MKKYFYIISAAALALASCSEEQELVNAPASQENRVLTATFEQDAATRTSIATADNALTWSNDDAIAVFGESAIKYNLSEASTGTFVIEDGTNAPEDITGAAFPYATDIALSSNTLTMTLPATIDQTTAGELDLPMWGTVTDGNIAFKHLAGVLKVNLTNLPESYTKLIVTASNPISGTFTAATTETTPVLASTSTNEADKTVTVSFTNTTATTLYLPLPVDTYNSIVVSVSNEDDTQTKVLKQWTDKTVERAKVYKTTVSDYTSVMTEEELRAAVAEDGEVTLGADVTLNAGLTISNNVTLNLNGKTLTLGSNKITNSGNLTLNNGNISTDVNEAIVSTGSLTMTDCEVTGEGTVVYVTDGKAEIVGGSYSNEGTQSLSDYCIAIWGGEATINTTVNAMVEGELPNSCNGGLSVSNNATVYIAGGEYNGNKDKSQAGLHVQKGAQITYTNAVEFNACYIQMRGETSDSYLGNVKVNGAEFVEADYGAGNKGFRGTKAQLDAQIAALIAAAE